MLGGPIASVGRTVESADNAPTQHTYDVFDKLSAPIDEQLAKWKELKDKDLPVLNDKISKANIPAIADTSQGRIGRAMITRPKAKSRSLTPQKARGFAMQLVTDTGASVSTDR